MIARERAEIIAEIFTDQATCVAMDGLIDLALTRGELLHALAPRIKELRTAYTKWTTEPAALFEGHQNKMLRATKGMLKEVEMAILGRHKLHVNSLIREIKSTRRILKTMAIMAGESFVELLSSLKTLPKKHERRQWSARMTTRPPRSYGRRPSIKRTLSREKCQP